MPLEKFKPNEDQRINYFLEEFPGALYNARIWSTRGSGGSVALINGAIGGQLRLRANSNKTQELYQSITGYSAASKTFFSTFIRPSTATVNITLTFGLNAATPNNATSYVAWTFDPAVSANWYTVSSSGGSATSVNTGLAVSTALSDFRIIIDTNAVQFFKDTVHINTITTNIPTTELTPFVLLTAGATAKDAFIDWIEVWNERY